MGSQQLPTDYPEWPDPKLTDEIPSTRTYVVEQSGAAPAETRTPPMHRSANRSTKSVDGSMAAYAELARPKMHMKNDLVVEGKECAIRRGIIRLLALRYELIDELRDPESAITGDSTKTDLC